MATIDANALKARKWKEHYSGFPADLFLCETDSAEPWAVTPHLHINYAIGGALQSLTYKNASGTNTYLYGWNGWDDQKIESIAESKLEAEAKYIKSLP